MGTYWEIRLGAVVEFLETGAGPDMVAAGAAVRLAAGLAAEECRPGGAGGSLLEKKWTAIVRLQKRVMELEERLASEAPPPLPPAGGAAPGGGVAPAAPLRASENAQFLPRAPPKLSLVGHRMAVSCVAWHPSFNLIATGSEDSLMNVYESERGDFERSLRGHTNGVTAIAFNSTGSLLASSSADMSVKVWDFTDKFECIRTLVGHDHAVSCVAFIPGPAAAGAERLVSCSRDKTIKLWDAASGHCTGMLSGHGDWVRRVVTSPEGSLIASASSDQTLGVWHTASGARTSTLSGHTNAIDALAFAPSAAADAAAGGELRKLAATRDAGRAAGGGAPPGEAAGAAGRGARYLASGARDMDVRVWDIDAAACVATLTGHTSWVRAVAFHPCGALLLSASEDRSVRVWALASATTVRVLEDAHASFVTCLALHPRRQLLATGGTDKVARVWECR